MNTYHKASLPWPAHRKHTPSGDRKYGQFKKGGCLINLYHACARVEKSVAAFTGQRKLWRTEELWIYADGKIGVNGTFLANSRCADPSVVVSFDMDGKGFTIACDTYTDAAQNLAAIAAYIEGLRAQERYGVATLGEMLTAHAQLPQRRSWRDILGNPATRAEAHARRNEIARAHHPDMGDPSSYLAEINAAYDIAVKELPE